MKTKHKQTGQSMSEYLAVMVMVMILLGVGFAGEGSVVTIFFNAVSEGFERFSSFISLP